MHSSLAVGVVLTAVVFSTVQCDTYYYQLRPQHQHQPRLLFSGGWGGGWKKPLVSVNKGWGWKIPTIKGIGVYGGIRLHHGLSQGGGKGWGSVSSGGWGGGGGGGGGHGGWGQKQQGWGWAPKQQGWGWAPKQEGWGWAPKQQGWGWGGGGGGGDGGGYDDEYERSSLPILVQAVQESDSTEDSSVESGEVQDSLERSDVYGPAEFDFPAYHEAVFY